jgi:3-isopropylmalate dehydrogenase
MLLRHSLGLSNEATAIEAAVDKTLADGVRGKDIGGSADTRAIEAALLGAL